MQSRGELWKERLKWHQLLSFINLVKVTTSQSISQQVISFRDLVYVATVVVFSTIRFKIDEMGAAWILYSDVYVAGKRVYEC